MKKTICLILAVLLLSSLTPVWAAGAGDCRCVLGADLSAEEIAEIYKTFGLERGGVKELTITNQEERGLLGGSVDAGVIGSKAISSIFIRVLPAGEGYQIATGNVNWCTEDMYRNALVTAGISDVELVVTAPFAVSGTAALAGIYKAWEDMTGQTLSAAAKSVGAQELVVTAELAEQIGSYDVTELVNGLKLILDETRDMDDQALKAQIQALASEYSITLNPTQLDQLAGLCRQLEKLDDIQLGEKVRSLQEQVKKLGKLQQTWEDTKETIGEIKDKTVEFMEKSKDFFQTLRERTQPVIDFIKGLFD